MNAIMTAEDFMDYLLKNKSTALPPEEMSRIVDQLVWYFADNGESIRDVLNRWGESDDLEKVEVVLGIKGHFPADNRDSLEQLLRNISTKWPQLKGSCTEIMLAWNKQFHDSGRI